MKKNFIATIATAFALSVLTASASAQTSSSIDFAKSVTTLTNHSAADGVSGPVVMPASEVETKVVRSFNRFFKDVTPRWYTDNGRYLARFTENGAQTHVLYKKNGFMLYSVTKGSGAILPREVSSLLRNAYPCYSVATATKVVSGGKTAWIADLKQDNTLLVVKVIDGEIVETTRYQNSN